MAGLGSLVAIQGLPSPAFAESAMPVISQLASDGQPILGAEPAGWRLTLIDFWASWCAPCRLSFPWLDAWQARYANHGLRVVGIGLDRREADALRFLNDVSVRFPIALDPSGESARKFDVRVMPSTYAITPSRQLRFLHRGFRVSDVPGLQRQIEAALS